MEEHEREKSNFPESLQEWLLFLASLVVLVAAGVVIYQLTKHGGDYSVTVQDLLGIPGRPTPTQSPVRIVGGSMKLRTTGSWTIKNPCPTGFQHTVQTCVLSGPIDFSAASLDGVRLAADSTTPAATSWLGLDKTWAMTVFARAQDGSIATAKGVDVCVSDGTKCGTGSYIAVATFDASTGLVKEVPNDVGSEIIFRYKDIGYDGKPGNFLEHIGKISFKVNSGATANTYTCPIGICQISIGL